MSFTFDSVKEVLERQVQPRLAQHGGGVKLCDVSEEGEVRISFTGHCCTCPAQEATLNSMVSETLKNAFPQESLTLIAVNTVDDDLWNMAKTILQHKTEV
ncbi:Fe/S biogenesis protein nfuA [Porphyromonas macacae]|uniref:Fe/S biogenesis protein nfuA n=1 Tax=Porphyromonas macacae TaxID=28115 RepID=A0A379E5X8_9PORP|nr:NifU family protein [Porphyromonas macacae]SUB88085.1 Fe/S biogenesis protein nfuA [Porphyromonas macacae]